MYIAAQARERLGFVMPGDIPYQVQLPPGAAVETGGGAKSAAVRSNDPWYTSLWHTIADAPRSATAADHPDDVADPSAATAAEPSWCPWWLIPPTWTPLRGSWGRERAACWRSPTVAPTVNRQW